MYMNKSIATAFLLIILTPWLSLAQEVQHVENANDPTAVDATVEEQVVSAEGNVNLDFKDAELHNVLRVLSHKSGVNIVAGPEVKGVVTIQLKDVPWKRALEVILETYGYGHQQKENIIIVTTIENLKKRREDALVLAEQEPLITKTFILNYAKAKQVIASIDKLKTDRGHINFDDRTNS